MGGRKREVKTPFKKRKRKQALKDQKNIGNYLTKGG